MYPPQTRLQSCRIRVTLAGEYLPRTCRHAGCPCPRNPPPPPPLACGRLSVFGKHPGSSGPSTQIARIPRRYLRHVKVRRTSHNTSPLKGCRHTVLQDLAAPFRACACRLASLSHVFNARSCANDAALPSLVPSTVEHRYPVARASSYRPLRRIFHALVLFSFVSH